MNNNNQNQSAPVIWALLDDRAGNRSQCLGVAECLGIPFVTKEVRYSPLARLPNCLLGASFLGLTMISRLGFREPWPDLVIAAGRRIGPVARAIKKRSGGRTKLVQIMYPGDAGIRDFDLVAVPTHDASKSGNNILSILGAPHGITEERLAQASDNWRDRLSELSTPRIAVLVGGSTRRRTFTEAMARELGQKINELAVKSGGGLMISTSRRTGRAAEEALFSQVTAPHQSFRWGEEGENPYLGYLATADVIVVTGDSVSMCSEVCASKAPVFIFAPHDLITDKHARLHQALYSEGYARPLTGEWETWDHPRLNSTECIADAIREKLGVL